MPDAPDSKPLAHRRGPDGRTQVGPDWETLIDRQIREAMEDGQFDNLPHQGEPLPNDDNPCAGELGLAFHVLRNAGVAPPWIEADKEVRDLLGRRDAILARAATGPSPSALARSRDRAALEGLVPGSTRPSRGSTPRRRRIASSAGRWRSPTSSPATTRPAADRRYRRPSPDSCPGGLYDFR
jgi:hypothetical protein